MTRRSVAGVAALAAALFLVACSSTRHAVEMQVGTQTFDGYMNVGPNAQDVVLEAADGAVSCKGVSLVAYAGLGCASEGSFRLACSDGREIVGDWNMQDCDSGEGTGQDQYGNVVTVAIGSSASLEVEPAREAPMVDVGTNGRTDGTYLFAFGGDYAAGFGAPEVLGDNIVFQDAFSGLVIVHRRGAVEMVLSRTSPADGEQAFVILPDGRAVAVFLRGLSPSGFRLDGVDVRASGLPVMDLNGQVMGLTYVVDGELRLFAADALRRYLRLFDPMLATAEAVAGTAGEFSERITAVTRD